VFEDRGPLTPLSPADRALIRRLRKLGLIRSVEDERAGRREGEAQQRAAGMGSARTLRRYASGWRPAAIRKEWLATQPPEVQEQQREVAEIIRLFQKWRAFRNAWRRATGDQRRWLEEHFDPIDEATFHSPD
jgi:hypothetical protein